MAIAIRQIHKHFVGEVSGVDLRQPLTKDEAAAIEAGMDKYAVLVFHGQDISDDQQMAFALNFGARENPRGGNITKKQDYRLGSAGLNDVSNLGKDGKPLPKDSRTHLFNLGNCLWHSDSSFRAIPAKFSLLSARLVNPKGGNTEFADMRAAYDALDDETKAEIDDKICEHSLMYSRGSLGFLDYTDEEKELFKPVLQRLVRTHPVHQRKSLYLSSHAGKVQGMSMPEGRVLLRDLTEHATQPEFVYVHKWTLHDLVMWDNRQTMHRVRRYDQSQPRDMRRATVAGTMPTVPQEAAERQLRRSRRRSSSLVGWAKARLRRAHHLSKRRLKKVGTLPPSLVELRRKKSLCPPYGFRVKPGQGRSRYACPASFDSMPGSMPILRKARAYLSSTSPPNTSSGSASQCSQPLPWISFSSWPGPQPA